MIHFGKKLEKGGIVNEPAIEYKVPKHLGKLLLDPNTLRKEMDKISDMNKRDFTAEFAKFKDKETQRYKERFEKDDRLNLIDEALKPGPEFEEEFAEFDEDPTRTRKEQKAEG